MKVQYTVRLDVLHAPEAAKLALADLGAIPVEKGSVKYEIPVKGAIRDRDGYRSAFMRDLQSLRSKGVIFDVVVTDEARKLIADGKIDAKTHVAIKPSANGQPAEKPVKAKA